MRKLIDEATAAELREFCRSNQNLDVKETHQKPHMISLLRSAGYALDDIEVPDKDQFEKIVVESEDGEKTDRPGVYFVTTVVRGQRQRRAYMNIVIPETADVGGSDAVPIAPNGQQIHVTRGVVTAVPIEHVVALDEAVEQHYEAVAEGGIRPGRRVMAYPYQTAMAGLENATDIVGSAAIKAGQVA